eukprot:8500163-Alexandrium_andersonii.AAC.1
MMRRPTELCTDQPAVSAMFMSTIFTPEPAGSFIVRRAPVLRQKNGSRDDFPRLDAQMVGLSH